MTTSKLKAIETEYRSLVSFTSSCSVIVTGSSGYRPFKGPTSNQDLINRAKVHFYFNQCNTLIKSITRGYMTVNDQE